MEVFSGNENDLHGLLLKYNTIIVYHKTRKVFRTFNYSDQKSKWNRILGYCERSLEFTESRFINRTLKDYLNSPGTYLIMYSQEELTSVRTMKDLMEDRPSVFV